MKIEVILSDKPNEHPLVLAFSHAKSLVVKENTSKEQTVKLQTSYFAKIVAYLDKAVSLEAKQKYKDLAIFSEIEPHAKQLDVIKSCDNSATEKINYM